MAINFKWTKEEFLDWVLNAAEDFRGNDGKWLQSDTEDAVNFVEALNAIDLRKPVWLLYVSTKDYPRYVVNIFNTELEASQTLKNKISYAKLKNQDARYWLEKREVL